MRVLVLTISDRAAAGEYEDRSGPAVEEVLRAGLADAEVDRAIVADDIEEIEKALRAAQGYEVVLTTGGTGLGPRDHTPEATERVCERPVPGLAELLRRESLRQTPNAVLSRGTAGLRGRTLVVNLPGSVRGAAFCAGVLAPLLPHAQRMIAGGGH
jgi:molybdenum cofactor synthesis domain-containing protein